MLAQELDYVIGVDTHRDAHALSFHRSPSGARLLEAEVAADQAGYADALALAEEHSPGPRAWALEGAGAYGKGLARHLQARGERVSRSSARSARAARAAAASRMPSMPGARPVPCSRASAWPRRGQGARGRRCACCSPRGRARSRPAAAP